MRLTKRAIDETRPDLQSDLFFWDDDVAGFGLRVKPSGAKSFIVQYRNRHGRSRRLTLGRYGVLTPNEARTAAKLALADVTRGGDPVEVKAAERGAVSMTELCKEYLERAESGSLITRAARRRSRPRSIPTEAGLSATSFR